MITPQERPNPRPILARTAPPSRYDKLRRGLWSIAWLLLYRPSPTPLHGWRRGVLRLFGARIGPGTLLYPSAQIWAPWNLEMARGSCLGPGVDCYSVGRITLKEDSVVSQRAFLCGASRDARDPGRPLLVGAIEIGARAWVAAEAFVGPGVRVSDGAVVAACAVTTRHVARNTIVAGNPARAIGRSDERQGSDIASAVPGGQGDQVTAT